MQKTKIEWCDYTWNPIKGICKMGYPYCYARRIYQRFKWDPIPRLDEKELMAPYKLKKPSKIFVCSTHEIFGWWIDEEWQYKIFKVIEDNPQHIFQILTKEPFGIVKYEMWKQQEIDGISIEDVYLDEIKLPSNVWFGITVDGNRKAYRTITLLSKSIKASVKWVSFEPLIERIRLNKFRKLFWKEFDWIVIGGLTGSRKMNCETHPEMKEWIDEIVAFAREHIIPVFIKDNAKYPEVIREFPDGGKPCHS